MKISKNLYMRISKITGVDYSGIVLGVEEFFIEPNVIEYMLKDLIYEVEKKEEKIEDLEREMLR